MICYNRGRISLSICSWSDFDIWINIVPADVMSDSTAKAWAGMILTQSISKNWQFISNISYWSWNLMIDKCGVLNSIEMNIFSLVHSVETCQICLSLGHTRTLIMVCDRHLDNWYRISYVIMYCCYLLYSYVTHVRSVINHAWW